MAEINQYTTEATSIDNDSFLDIDQYIAGDYESQKIKWSTIQGLISASNLGNSDLVATDSIRNYTINGTTKAAKLNILNPTDTAPLFNFDAGGDFNIHGAGYNGINFTKWGALSSLKQGYDGHRYLRLAGEDRLDLVGGDGGNGVETTFKLENNVISSSAREFYQFFSYGTPDKKFRFILEPTTGFNDLELNHVGARNNGVWFAKGGFQSTPATPPTARVNNFGLHTALNSGSVIPMFTLENGDQIKLFKQTLPPAPVVADIVTLLTNLGLV